MAEIPGRAMLQLSNSFNPFLGYPNQNKLGDYITIVSDNAGANVAYAATFNGEEDIYYVRIVSPPSHLGNISASELCADGRRCDDWRIHY